MKAAAALLACALLMTVPGTAQGQWSVHGSGGLAGWVGEDYSRLQAGMQLEGGLGYQVAESLVVGGSVGLGRFGYQGRGELASLSDVGVNLRWLAASLAGGTAYALGNAGLSWLSLEDDVEVKQSGWTAGIGAGFLYPVADAVDLDLSGGWAVQDMGDSRLDGEDIPNSGSFGYRWALRLGIRVSVGR